MHGKWTFGLVVLLIPNLLDASAALANLRRQALRLPTHLGYSVLRFQVAPQLMWSVRGAFTGPRNFKQSESWDKVSSAKKEMYELILARAHALRKARREAEHQAEFFNKVAHSWVPAEIHPKLLSENCDMREEGKTALAYHFMVLQARAEKPPK